MTTTIEGVTHQVCCLHLCQFWYWRQLFRRLGVIGPRSVVGWSYACDEGIHGKYTIRWPYNWPFVLRLQQLRSR